MSVTVIATMFAAEGKRDELLAEVCKIVPAVLAEDGCLQYAPHTVGKDRIVMIESWASLEALQAHGQAPALASLRESTSHLVSAPADVVVARPVEVPTA
jgi:quinol monooxygenase YgiN